MTENENPIPPPDFVEPVLAAPVLRTPSGDDWVHEIKFDGFRIIARVDGDRTRIFTRKRSDITERLPHIVDALRSLPVENAWVDGEIAILRPDGTTSFRELKIGFRRNELRDVVFFVFDLPFLNGRDLSPLPLLQRKEMLRNLLTDNGRIRFVDHVVGHGEDFSRQACTLGLEGIVSKKADSPYIAGRGGIWLKSKCRNRQEFVIGGYTQAGVRGREFGSLLVGAYRGTELHFIGKVVTGFPGGTMRTLGRLLGERRQDVSPFVDPPTGGEFTNAGWVRPELVAEVEYTDIAEPGHMRHGAFKGLRDDKDPLDVVLEVPVDLAQAEDIGSREPLQEEMWGNLKVTLIHPQKELYTGEGITKKDIFQYYLSIWERMYHHVAKRPLTAVQCHQGVPGGCRYKKHGTELQAGVLAIPMPGHVKPYIAIDNFAGLMGLLNMSVVEIHTWGCRYNDLEHPDKLVFDLDPGEDVPWEALAEAVLLVRNRLLRLGLQSFLKTTGGKGYHVVVPLLPEKDWNFITPFTRRFAEDLAFEHSGKLTAKLAKEHRSGKILIDWMRNGRGTNAVEVWSTRARPGAPVSTPLHWDELVEGIRPDAFTVRNIPARLAQQTDDPWKDYFSLRQTLPE